MVKLGEAIEPVQRPEVPIPGKTYRQIGVRLWGGGAYERESMDGGETKYAQLFRAEAGDVIVNKIWARNGSVAVVDRLLTGTFGSAEFPMFKPRHDRVTPKWLHWLTKTPFFWEQCDLHSRGTSGQNRIRPERFLEIEIPLPPLPEQRRVVARIEELSAEIQEARALRHDAANEAEALTKAHLNRLFGDPSKGIKGRMNSGPWVRLNDVVSDVADGPHVTPSYVSEGVPFITVLNITSGRIRFDHHKYITAEDHAQFQRRAKAECGDVLISKDGTIGVPCFIDTDKPFSFFVSVALIKPKRQLLDGEYLTWVIRTPALQERIAERSRGDMIRHLVLREIRDLAIPVPPLPEQRRIVSELDALQTDVGVMKRLQAETEAELDALLPAILDRAFGGEL